MPNALRSAKLNSAYEGADAYTGFGQLYKATRKPGPTIEAAR